MEQKAVCFTLWAALLLIQSPIASWAGENVCGNDFEVLTETRETSDEIIYRCRCISGYARIEKGGDCVPVVFAKPRARLNVRSVPNPMQAPMGSWLRYVRSDRAGLILDALKYGNGDLDRSITYLDDQMIRYGAHVKASTALSYLEGLKRSYIAAGDQYRERAKYDGQVTTLESRLLLQAVLESGKLKWPGPQNPHPEAKPLNRHDWRVKRSIKMLKAIKTSPGNLEQTYRILQADNQTIIADNAEFYLRGVFAYWDYLGTKSGE